MGKLMNIGFGNVVNTSKVIAIINPDSAPIKRMIQNAKDAGMAIDATQGRRTKAVIVMENNELVLSALQPETLTGRFAGKVVNKDEEDESIREEYWRLFPDFPALVKEPLLKSFSVPMLRNIVCPFLRRPVDLGKGRSMVSITFSWRKQILNSVSVRSGF